MLFAMLIPQASFVANAVFLGAYGELELRVIGIAGVSYLILAMIGHGLSNGLQIQMSRRMGEGDRNGLARTLTNGMMLSVSFSLVLILLARWLTPLVFNYSLYDADNITHSIRFMHIRVWGLPFLMLTQLANAFFIATQRSGFLIYGAVAGTFVNILFDYLLIFGQYGFPEMGLAGAASASMLGEITGCCVTVAVFFITRQHRRYPVLRMFRFNVALSRTTLTVASPLIIQYLFSIGGWQVFFIYVEHLGNSQLAASQMLRSLFGVAWVGLWAFAATANTMVSHIIGQGKPKLVSYLTGKIVRLSMLYAVVVCTGILCFAETLLLFFRKDTALAALAMPGLYVALVSTLVMSASTVVFNSVVGTGNTLVNLFIEIACVLCYVGYCYVFIERLRLPLGWAWGSELAYWTSLLLLSLVYLKSGRWKGKKI